MSSSLFARAFHRFRSPAGPSGEGGTPEEERAEGKGLWVTRVPWMTALMIVSFYGVDLLILGRFSLWPLLVRMAWATNLLLHAWIIRRLSGPKGLVLTAINGALTCLCVLLLVFAMGGVGSPYFVLIPTLPLAIAMMGQREVMDLLLRGTIFSVGTLVLSLQSGLPVREAAAWALTAVGTTLFGVYGSSEARRLRRMEGQARLDRARSETLEALALSERRRAQSEKLAIVGRLAANVAHEINNPLAYVRSNVDYVRRELLEHPRPEQEELVEVLEETRTGIEHIRRIVSDLKGFSRMDVEEPMECALADVVADAAKLASFKLRSVAGLRVEVPAELPEIFVVRRRLVQVVLNLLVNAGDVLEEHRVQGGEVRVVGRTEEDRVVLLVEDNGPGFAPDVLPRLFEAFFTTKGLEQGTGLGLTVSRELVEQFGGSLSAENRPEGGARLRLAFPARRAGVSSAAQERPERASA